MSEKIKSIDELKENSEICSFCSTTDYGERAEVNTPNGLIMCEGSYCDLAYEYYLDEKDAI